MKHTPGPWRVGYLEYAGLAIKATADKADEHVAQLSAELSSGDMSANAHLIAAAPDLLEAANHMLLFLKEFNGFQAYEEMLGHHGSTGAPAVLKLRAAIAKAKGEK